MMLTVIKHPFCSFVFGIGRDVALELVDGASDFCIAFRAWSV